MLRIMKFMILLISIGYAGDEELISEIKFDSHSCLKKFKIEGPGKASVKAGKLILEPQYYSLLAKLMREGKISKNNLQHEYRPYLEEAFRKDGKDLSRYTIEKEGEKVFMGGHFNFWCLSPLSGDFAIEYDFRSLSAAPLQMIMFSASGLKGESIFADSMPPRVGVAREIMFGPMYQYRISYFHPTRKTANMRRAPGRNMVARGQDLVSLKPSLVSKCRIERRGKTVRYLVNGKEALQFIDDKPLKGGHWGFRLMAPSKGEYDNIRVIKLN